MARAAKKPATNEEPIYPVAGVAEYEKPSWLPENTGLGWLDALRTKHVAACREFGKCVGACTAIEDEVEGAQRKWRRAVRDAVAAGEEPPERDFERLRWTDRKLTYYVRGFAAEARATAELVAPDICVDARAAAGRLSHIAPSMRPPLTMKGAGR